MKLWALLVILIIAVVADVSAQSIPPYNRADWPHWKSTEERPCINVRERVLIDQSAIPATLDYSNCKIEAGKWVDPYTSVIITDPQRMDVDHIVPLKWAHDHGGWKWAPHLKERFANDPVNLVAVLDSENQRKGSDGPSRYQPPDAQALCAYARRFVVVLWKYHLTPGAADRSALLQQLALCPARL